MPSPASGRSITFDRSTWRLSFESAQKYVLTQTTTNTVASVIVVRLTRRRQFRAGRGPRPRVPGPSGPPPPGVPYTWPGL